MCLGRVKYHCFSTHLLTEEDEGEKPISFTKLKVFKGAAANLASFVTPQARLYYMKNPELVSGTGSLEHVLFMLTKRDFTKNEFPKIQIVC